MGQSVAQVCLMSTIILWLSLPYHYCYCCSILFLERRVMRQTEGLFDVYSWLLFSDHNSHSSLNHCVTQLMLYTGDKLSSPIFCLWVSVSGISNTRPNLHFFQYIQAYKPFADHVPPNTKQYQLILTKYQPVSSYTDPVPSSTTYNSSSRKAQFSQLNNLSFYDSFDESRTVYLV